MPYINEEGLREQRVNELIAQEQRPPPSSSSSDSEGTTTEHIENIAEHQPWESPTARLARYHAWRATDNERPGRARGTASSSQGGEPSSTSSESDPALREDVMMDFIRRNMPDPEDAPQHHENRPMGRAGRGLGSGILEPNRESNRTRPAQVLSGPLRPIENPMAPFDSLYQELESIVGRGRSRRGQSDLRDATPDGINRGREEFSQYLETFRQLSLHQTQPQQTQGQTRERAIEILMEQRRQLIVHRNQVEQAITREEDEIQQQINLWAADFNRQSGARPIFQGSPVNPPASTGARTGRPSETVSGTIAAASSSQATALNSSAGTGPPQPPNTPQAQSAFYSTLREPLRPNPHPMSQWFREAREQQRRNIESRRDQIEQAHRLLQPQLSGSSPSRTGHSALTPTTTPSQAMNIPLSSYLTPPVVQRFRNSPPPRSQGRSSSPQRSPLRNPPRLRSPIQMTGSLLNHNPEPSNEDTAGLLLRAELLALEQSRSQEYQRRGRSSTPRTPAPANIHNPGQRWGLPLLGEEQHPPYFSQIFRNSPFAPTANSTREPDEEVADSDEEVPELVSASPASPAPAGEIPQMYLRPSRNPTVRAENRGDRVDQVRPAEEQTYSGAVHYGMWDCDFHQAL